MPAVIRAGGKTGGRGSCRGVSTWQPSRRRWRRGTGWPAPPPADSRWLAERIPHATAHFPAGEDHTQLEENNRSAAIAWVRSHI